jgi:ubiquinone/menaquinone biosynthesis C-methylase UbiE
MIATELCQAEPLEATETQGTDCFQSQSLGGEHSLTDAWQDSDARHEISRIIQDGILKEQPELAESLLVTLARSHAKNCTDNQTLSLLRSALEQPHDQKGKNASFTSDEAQRIERRVQQIAQFLPQSFNPESIIDIGCGDGRITEQLAMHWSLSKKNILGTDVWDRHNSSEAYTYQTNNPGELPAEDNSMDFANLMMVLHHEADPALLLSEMYRVLKPGGIAFVREHDTETASDSRVFHAMDLLYYSLFNDLKGIPVPAMYNSAEHWQAEIENTGFKILKEERPEPNSPMKPIHLLLYKPG